MHCTVGDGHIVIVKPRKGTTRYAHEDLICPEHHVPLMTGMQLNARKSRGGGLGRKQESDALAEAHLRFTTLVREWPCWFKDRVGGRRRRPDHECWGRKDPHHLVPAQFIKDVFKDLDDVDLGDILYAPIIGVPLCRRGHEAVELHSDYVYWHELDDEVKEFCRRIDAKYPERLSMLEQLRRDSPELVANRG
jgi:hypothetical protein